MTKFRIKFRDTVGRERWLVYIEVPKKQIMLEMARKFAKEHGYQFSYDVVAQ